jgi:hypothetical protein
MAFNLLRVLGIGSPRPTILNDKPVEAAGDAAGRTRTVADPFMGGVAVTPSDTVALAAEHRALWIGTGGTISAVVLDADNTTPNTIATTVGDGSIFPFRVIRVNATGTTATGIVAGY